MPPDLNEVARPLAVPSPQSYGGAISAAVLPPRPTANGVEVHQSNCRSLATGAGGKGVCEAKASSHAAAASAVAVSKYLLTPALRNTFADVGASNKAYSFKEILGFLKAYLYSKRHMFDTEDILYVNCKDDSLGDVLKVDRFHFNDVRSLIARHVLQEPPKNVENNASKEEGSIECVIADSSSVLKRQSSCVNVNQELISSSVSSLNGCVNPIPFVNGKTFSGPSSWTGSQNSNHHQEVEKQNSLPYSSLPGSSRQSTENLLHLNRRRQCLSGLASVTIKIPVPAVPDCNSDSESVYSYQGYETAYCHNTEYEDTDDASEEIEFEEYELASDDEDGQEMEHSDDSDSVIEDVEVALLAVHAVYEDELEEDFWADGSDNESTDDDPELAHEMWSCVSCGVKNKPFVRYCGKCWQLRKNWLPERPKRKRRKPRPKKKLRSRKDSIQSEGSVADNKELESLLQPDESGQEASELLRGSSSSSSVVTSATTDSGLETSDLVRTASTATTVSLGIASPPSFSFDQFSSQDSGICLSQDIYTEYSSQDIGMADIEVKPSCSRGPVPSSGGSQENEMTLEQSGSGASESTSRKRKSTSLNDDSKAKRSRSSNSIDSSGEEPSAADSETVEMLKMVNSMYLEYAKSKGRDWTKPANTREMIKEFQKIVRGSSDSESENEASNLCLICCSRPKNATITHGRISHQATCYQCARRLLDTGARCPVCRRKIHMVSKNIRV